MTRYSGLERRRARGVKAWLDYRTFAMGGFFVITLLVFYSVVSSNHRAAEALRAQAESRQAASRRIDLLTGEIRRLTSESKTRGEQVAELQAQVEALIEQVRQMGGNPVVVVRPSAGQSPSPQSTGRPSASPTPSRTRPPRPSPSHTPPRPSSSPSEPPFCLPVIGCP
jgi:hypothetical protein